MPNARQKILNYIHEQQSSTVDELSKVFRVTPANIRHHLSILVEQGSIKVIGQRAAAYRGRPTQIYSSSQQENLHNLDHLSGALL
jgi:predicted ArsR family transcriptional regulator